MQFIFCMFQDHSVGSICTTDFNSSSKCIDPIQIVCERRSMLYKNTGRITLLILKMRTRMRKLYQCAIWVPETSVRTLSDNSLFFIFILSRCMDLMKCLTSLRVNRQFFSRYQARYYCFSLGQIPINSVYAMATVYPVYVVIICKSNGSQCWYSCPCGHHVMCYSQSCSLATKKSRDSICTM